MAAIAPAPPGHGGSHVSSPALAPQQQQQQQQLQPTFPGGVPLAMPQAAGGPAQALFLQQMHQAAAQQQFAAAAAAQAGLAAQGRGGLSQQGGTGDPTQLLQMLQFQQAQVQAQVAQQQVQVQQAQAAQHQQAQAQVAARGQGGPQAQKQQQQRPSQMPPLRPPPHAAPQPLRAAADVQGTPMGPPPTFAVVPDAAAAARQHPQQAGPNVVSGSDTDGLATDADSSVVAVARHHHQQQQHPPGGGQRTSPASRAGGRKAKGKAPAQPAGLASIAPCPPSRKRGGTGGTGKVPPPASAAAAALALASQQAADGTPVLGPVASASAFPDELLPQMSPTARGGQAGGAGADGKDAPPKANAKAAARERNREHARNTRIRKKAYLDKLKVTVEELCRERDVLVSERSGAADLMVEMHNTRTDVLLNFFALRSGNERRRDLWASILDESCFACIMPVTPYRSFPAPETQVARCQRNILGIDGMMNDTASLHVLLNSLIDRSVHPDKVIKFRYTIITEDAVVAGNQMMARWTMTTVNAFECGAKVEVSKHGMLCCKFNSAHKITGIEIMFDVMAFMLQLKQAQGCESFNVIPNTVQTCQRPFDVPMVMTLAERPYTIVQVNRLWEEMTGWKAEEVVGHTSCRVLQGDDTERAVAHSLMEDVHQRRPTGTSLTNYTKSLRTFRNFINVYPLSTDSKVTHFVALTAHAEWADGKGGEGGAAAASSAAVKEGDRMQPPPRPKAAPSKEAIHAASIQTLSTASVPTQPKASATGTSQQKNGGGGGSGQSPDSGRDASSKPKQVTIDTSMNQRNSRNGGGDTVSTTSDLSADGDSAGDNSGNNTPQQQQGVDGTSQPNGAAPVSILKNSVADVSVGDSALTSSSPSSDGQGGAIQSRIGRKRKRKGKEAEAEAEGGQHSNDKTKRMKHKGASARVSASSI